MIVVDASAVIEYLLKSPVGAKLAGRIGAPAETLHATHLLDLEVAHVLRRFVLAGELAETRGREALADFAALPLTRYPHAPFLRRIWSVRSSLTAYDAAYVVLAEALEAPLLTADKKLSRAHGHTARVELIDA
ncbi:MAG: type II toxin-antitoxin system VapC family toxin [Gammaproteobacteria bacterium]